ncbi:hypothetical protein DFH11DRAFT_694496 [Phellopilus nigrolimitatus]|nr:hypothetical protein DFH11DRAFT_694496 [Phellopilus nigrolimitatus]
MALSHSGQLSAAVPVSNPFKDLSMDTSTAIDLSGINTLESVIAFLKVPGTSHKLFDIDGPLLSSMMFNCNDVSSITIVLQKLKSMQRTIVSLLDAVSKSVSDLKEAVMPVVMKHGLESLPNEVLAHIFELACRSCGSFSRNIIKVCHRFYDIATRLPNLWTYVSNAYLDVDVHSLRRDNPAAFLTRSRSSNLTVYLKLPSRMYREINENYIRDIFLPETLLRHTNWEKFIVNGLDEWSEDYHHCLDYLCSSSTGLDFPALTTLVLLCGDAPQDLDGFILNDDEDNDIDVNSKNFFETWNMPSLRTLELTNFIPRSTTIFTSVTKCSISFTRYSSTRGNEPVRWNLAVVIRFLDSLPALNDLTIEMCNALFTNMDDESTEPLSLQKLCLISEYCEEESIGHLTKALDTVNLRDFSIHINLHSTDCSEPWLKCFFPDGRMYPMLRDLSIKVTNLGGRDSPFDIISETIFPRLQHLTINAREVEQPDSFGLSRMPLETLRLENCHWFNNDFTVNLRHLWDRPEFETLEIIGCRSIDKDIVEEKFPRSKRLVWED